MVCASRNLVDGVHSNIEAMLEELCVLVRDVRK